MNQKVFARLDQLLRSQAIEFSVLEHEPVFTSQQAAQVRGVSLASGAKALICKADDHFRMFVLPADRKLDSKGLRKQCGIKSLRFAARDEVAALTGLEPGSIPPFGSLFDLPTFCDPLLGENRQINFNAGDHSISISMRYDDYLSVERPQIVACSLEG